ncbi:MAG: hypothetical protein M1819_002655 [Sarea resinae]|nr:MAG: hypothetical protein M1819_002655 [Sarea resinae]
MTKLALRFANAIDSLNTIFHERERLEGLGLTYNASPEVKGHENLGPLYPPTPPNSRSTPAPFFGIAEHLRFDPANCLTNTTPLPSPPHYCSSDPSLYYCMPGSGTLPVCQTAEPCQVKAQSREWNNKFDHADWEHGVVWKHEVQTLKGEVVDVLAAGGGKGCFQDCVAPCVCSPIYGPAPVTASTLSSPPTHLDPVQVTAPTPAPNSPSPSSSAATSTQTAMAGLAVITPIGQPKRSNKSRDHAHVSTAIIPVTPTITPTLIVAAVPIIAPKPRKPSAGSAATTPISTPRPQTRRSNQQRYMDRASTEAVRTPISNPLPLFPAREGGTDTTALPLPLATIEPLARSSPRSHVPEVIHMTTAIYISPDPNAKTVYQKSSRLAVLHKGIRRSKGISGGHGRLSRLRSERSLSYLSSLKPLFSLRSWWPSCSRGLSRPFRSLASSSPTENASQRISFSSSSSSSSSSSCSSSTKSSVPSSSSSSSHPSSQSSLASNSSSSGNTNATATSTISKNSTGFKAKIKITPPTTPSSIPRISLTPPTPLTPTAPTLKLGAIRPADDSGPVAGARAGAASNSKAGARAMENPGLLKPPPVDFDRGQRSRRARLRAQSRNRARYYQTSAIPGSPSTSASPPNSRSSSSTPRTTRTTPATALVLLC